MLQQQIQHHKRDRKMAKKPVASVSDFTEDKKQALYSKITAWHNAAAEAAKYSATENTLQKEIAAEFFDNPTEGTNTLDVGFGKVLKLDLRISRSVDTAQYEAMVKKLLENSNSDDPEHSVQVQELKDILAKCVTFKPQVIVSGYKALSGDEKLLIADVIKESVGLPGLVLHTPA